jgi:AraC-like DNA-binding protein
MFGIDVNQTIAYKHASFRYFNPNEHHITRFCEYNVLLLVFAGVLRFSEDGEQQEVHAGEYYIQRKNCHQAGELASDTPHYLYIHFDGEWIDSDESLPYKGSFDYALLSELMGSIDEAAHRNTPYAELQYLMLKLILRLRGKPIIRSTARKFSDYIEAHMNQTLSLADLCDEFHYSKNYIIRIFNEEFGVTPIQYINEAKMKRAMHLLEATSRPIGDIVAECGYLDYAYFYKRFVQKTGLSPLKWRKQMQHNPLF